ncbi:TPR repeat-containing protein [Candidatus Terasakiella magnetica]|nr:TPR repeat-containing protein [Candidatus Terasakiella magnetica]
MNAKNAPSRNQNAAFCRVPPSDPTGFVFEAACRHFAAGELDDCERLCRDILSAESCHADALHLLGLIATQRGCHENAADLITSAISIQSGATPYYFNLGCVQLELGRVDEAIASFLRSLCLQGDAFESHVLLGDAFQRRGHPKDAVRHYRNAITLRPDSVEAFNNMAMSLMELDHREEALAAFRHALAVLPGTATLHHNIGWVLEELEQLDEAEEHYRRSIAGDPGAFGSHVNLGNVLMAQKHESEAMACFRRTIILKPDWDVPYNNLGNALIEAEQLDEAAACSHRALTLDPTQPDNHNVQGNLLRESGRPEDALASYRHAIELQHDFTAAYANMGSFLNDLGRYEEAEEQLRKALAFDRDSFSTSINLSNTLRALGRLDEAEEVCRRAIAIKPDSPEAHCNLSQIDLLKGNFTDGWNRYEWRWLTKTAGFDKRRDFPQPLWSGDPADGRTILLWSEQGLGDSIQFVRYVSLVQERGWRIVLEIPAVLFRLFSSLDGVSLVVRGQQLPPFDVQCPLLSLPLIFGTTLETVPARIPYLRADPARTEAWRTRLAELTGPVGDDLLVGLVWAGNTGVGKSFTRKMNLQRSMRLNDLAALGGFSGIRFISLQKDPPASLEALSPPEGMRLADPMSNVSDFSDTADLIECLDLVISVDTSVAHLAGALGKPVWVLSRFNCCWRWMVDTEASPWYPTMRLFRQSRPGDWRSIETAVTAALGEVLRNPPRKRSGF